MPLTLSFAPSAICYRRDYLRTTVAMPARIFGDDFSLGDGLEDGSAHQ